jgi:transposase-like protein
VNSRNGYRSWRWDTRAGSIDLAVPKLRSGSYFPDWLIEPRRRAERALVAVVAQCYVEGVSTRRVDDVLKSMGIAGISKSQVSELVKSLDETVVAFRNRPLDAGPYTYIWVDALTQKVREGGRIVNVAVIVATGVNADGHREILGVDLIATEDGAGWTAFLRGLVARGLSGVAMVVSDARQGLVDAIASVLPGATWQRCRVHFVRNVHTKVPKSAQSMVGALVGRSSSSLTPNRSMPNTPGWSNNSPSASMPPPCWWRPRPTSWPSPPSRRSTGARPGPTTPRSGSTRRSAGAPMSSGSSPTGQR